jgi:DNA-directed RNA polymerase specialized sigma subunit
MITEVNSEPVAQWFGQQATQEGWPHKLSSATIADDFACIERSFAAFMQPNYTLGEFRTELIGGILAYQEVLFSTFRKTKEQCRRFSTQGILSEDDLFQEAVYEVMENIMTFRPDELDGGSLDRFFYNRMAVVVNGVIRRRLDEERWDTVGVSERRRQLIRRMLRAIDRLQQDLGREPSPAEIATRLEEDEDSVLEALSMMERSNLSFEVGFYAKERAYHSIEQAAIKGLRPGSEIDDLIERLDRQAKIDRIFDSNDIATRSKIAMSLYYGIYVPQLDGEAFTKRQGNGEVFVYPNDETSFRRIVKSSEGSTTLTAALLNYNKPTFTQMLQRALVQAREVLKKGARGA